MSNVTFRMFLEKMGGKNPLEFIGRRGDIFFDPYDGVLRLSDGITPGGTQISGANATITLVDGGNF